MVKEKKKQAKKKESSKKDKKIVTVKIPSIRLKHIAIVLGVLLAVSIFFNLRGGCFGTGKVTSSTGIEDKLTENEASDKAIDYINNNLIATGEVTLVSVEETNGVYKLTTSYQDQEIPIYTTLDGTYMFLPQGTVSLDETTDTTEPEPEEVPQQDEPVVNAFVMSYCPYGLQFIKAYVPVMELLGDKADIQLNFVDYIMHGEKEIVENNRMYCIQLEQSDKFTDYLRCSVETDEAEKENCLEQVGIDVEGLDECISGIDEEYNITGLYEDRSTWSNGQFPLYPIESELNDMYGVRGSPTFVVNGKTVSVNRSPEAIKETICSGFTNPPEECEDELSAAAESPGIGPIGSGSGDSGSTGQC
ncbi:MAG: hypothetical protein GF368_01610 [Candidatus Aenigmarchaeota archaeon]|nr:hypothetical protein [Candidatus Aenigmarchaeota archaeon]